jgi:hypothetical protein
LMPASDIVPILDQLIPALLNVLKSDQLIPETERVPILDQLTPA